MLSGITTARPKINSNRLSFVEDDPQSLTTPANTQIHPAREDEDGNRSTSRQLDAEQRASASILAEEETEYMDDFDEGSTTIPRSMSTSFCPCPEPVSVSPAAMFLSAFSSPSTPALPDAEGCVISGYTLGSIIGYGAFSTIRRASSTSGGVVAVKIVRGSDFFKQGNVALARKRIKREAAVWSTLSHEHILPLFSALHTSYADYFITLLCPAGSLFDILKRDGCPALPQDDVGMMFRQVVRGLRYLHEVALFVHRDIKLENVLVDEAGTCRIGDFGMTRKIGEFDEDEDEVSQEQNHETFQAGHATVHRAVSLALPPTKRQSQPRGSLQAQLVRHNHNGARHRNSTSSPHPAHSPHIFQPGSLPYASPELLLPQTAGPLLPHPAQDIWALGVLLYGLLTGRLPFADSFEPRLQMKILNGAYDVPPGIGRGAERVLQGCLDRSTATRWTIAMVDEVAWGIGWGAEGDDVTPADSDEEFHTLARNKNVKSPSRSRSRRPLEVVIPESPDWQHDEQRSRPSLEAASRRSSSRIKRSLSRAPIITSRSSSVRPMLNRSVSRHSRASSPSVTAISVFSSAVMSSGIRSASSSRSTFHDSALVISPPLSLERGRRLRKVHGRSVSRSPSPSIAPTTPTDATSQFSISGEILRVQPDDMERSASRGRPKYSRGLRRLHSDHLYSAGADTTSELDVLDETADWAAPNSAPQKRSFSVTGQSFSGLPNSRRAHGDDTCLGMGRGANRSHSKPTSDQADSFFSQKRPESSPPAPTSFWSSASGHASCKFVTPVLPVHVISALTKPTSLEGLTRSRSLEPLRLGDETWLYRG